MLVEQCNVMESNLCVICFVDDDRYLVKVGEKGLETLVRHKKLHCDEKLEKDILRELLGVRATSM